MSDDHSQNVNVDVGGIAVDIDRWFSDNFAGSVVARDTEVYNYVHEAVQRLKELLKARGK
jgi:hypothetical protein